MAIENRGRFFDRLVFLPKADLMDIHLAYALAKHWFRAKYRKETDAQGNPVRYFEHLRRVALVLIDELKIARPEMIIAALLHDAIEDTAPEDMVPEMIERHFGAEVTGLVKLLSKVPKEGYLERLSTFGDWRALLLKGCDRLDNLRSLHAGTPAFQRKQIDETRVKYYPLFDRMVALAPAAEVAKAAYLRTQIQEIAESYAAQAAG